MPPQPDSLPVPRGRALATKPLTTRKTQVSPVSVDQRPAGAATSENPAAATRHEQKLGRAADDTAKPQSHPLQAIFPDGLPPTKEISNPPSSDNVNDDEDASPQPDESMSGLAHSTLISQPQPEPPTGSPVPPPEPLQAAAQVYPKDPSPPSVEETPVRPTPSDPTDYTLISQPQPEPPTGFPIPPPEPLQVTAQSYPWLYMSSTLEACFTDIETPTKNEDHHESEISASKGETPPDGGKTRYEGEHAIEFCDDSSSDTFIKEAPVIMQSFMTFSEVSERIEAEALQLAMSTPSLESEEPLNAYNDMMDKLGKLLHQAEDIQSAIQRLTTTTTVSEDEAQSSSSSSLPETDRDHDTDGEQEHKHKHKPGEETDSARAQILGVFQACLPVLGARIANLSMAQELIDNAQENFSLALRMEDMGID